jgi:hypothetical protein
MKNLADALFLILKNDIKDYQCIIYKFLRFHLMFKINNQIYADRKSIKANFFKKI